MSEYIKVPPINKPLTSRQRAYLGAVEQWTETHHTAPTHSEMAAIMGYKSRTASVGMVNALARKGYLQNNYENRRGIRLSDRYAVVVIDMEAKDE